MFKCMQNIINIMKAMLFPLSVQSVEFTLLSLELGEIDFSSVASVRQKTDIVVNLKM